VIAVGYSGYASFEGARDNSSLLALAIRSWKGLPEMVWDTNAKVSDGQDETFCTEALGEHEGSVLAFAMAAGVSSQLGQRQHQCISRRRKSIR
jgi:hypothetical protein